jgi:type IV pilus assembly protein PilC
MSMNENIYKTPQSDFSGEVSGISVTRKILWAIGILFTASIYGAIYKVVPQFAETFSSFGADLPLLTRVSIDLHNVFIWFAVVSLLFISFLIVSIFNEKYADIMLKISKYNLTLSVVIFVLFMISMYLPIFTLGNVI